MYPVTFKVDLASSLILTYTSIFLLFVMEIFFGGGNQHFICFAVFSENVDILLLDTLIG